MPKVLILGLGAMFYRSRAYLCWRHFTQCLHLQVKQTAMTMETASVWSVCERSQRCKWQDLLLPTLSEDSASGRPYRLAFLHFLCLLLDDSLNISTSRITSIHRARNSLYKNFLLSRIPASAMDPHFCFRRYCDKPELDGNYARVERSCHSTSSDLPKAGVIWRSGAGGRWTILTNNRNGRKLRRTAERYALHDMWIA